MNDQSWQGFNAQTSPGGDGRLTDSSTFTVDDVELRNNVRVTKKRKHKGRSEPPTTHITNKQQRKNNEEKKAVQKKEESWEEGIQQN